MQLKHIASKVNGTGLPDHIRLGPVINDAGGGPLHTVIFISILQSK